MRRSDSGEVTAAPAMRARGTDTLTGPNVPSNCRSRRPLRVPDAPDARSYRPRPSAAANSSSSSPSMNERTCRRTPASSGSNQSAPRNGTSSKIAVVFVMA